MIRLQLLGALDLRGIDGTGADAELRAVLAQPRRLALLAYLAIAGPRFQRRDVVLSLFWPEDDSARARASLNRAIYFLRRELGDGVLVSRGDGEIGLSTERLSCDAAEFHAAFETGDWERALNLYCGELLPGFHISGAAGFEEWLESERARLRESAARAAWKMAEREEAAGRFVSATSWARRSVDLDPFREVAFRRFLSLLDRMGDRAGAVNAYVRFADEMAADLNVAPSPETQALIDAIRARAASAHGTDSPGNDVTATGPAPSNSGEAPALVIQRRRRPRRMHLLAATAALIVLATVAVTRGAARELPVDPLRVDIAPWENRTGDRALDRLGTLAVSQLLDAIRVTGLVKDSRLQDRSAPSRAGTLVSGAFDRTGDTLRVHVLITDVRRGGAAWPVTTMAVPIDSARDAIDRIRSHALGAVIALRDPRLASLFPVATPPPSWPALQEFLQGMKLESRRQIHDALRHYRWAAGIDSAFTWSLIHAGLVSLFWAPESVTLQVDSILTDLRPGRDRLPPLQRHLLDYLSAVRAEDWDAAYRAMRRASELSPAEFSVRFANKAIDRNRPLEAIAMLRRPGLDSIYRADIRGYWYALTHATHIAGEHRTELAIARRARQNAPQNAHAVYQEVAALAALGRMSAVRASLDTLLALPMEDWFNAPVALEMVAFELRAHGYAEAASEQLERAIAWHHARPNAEQGAQERREHLAQLLYRAGRWADADTLFNALVRDYPASRGYPDNTEYLGYLGMIAAHRGERARARGIAAQLQSRERAQPIPGQEAVVYRAKIAALLGDREEAMRLLIAAYGAAGTTELHGDADLEGMRDYPPFQEFVRPKG
jgi:DNA-binding SARP family transcriptional activator/tetratricopeptide (TPR) repeat protein